MELVINKMLCLPKERVDRVTKRIEKEGVVYIPITNINAIYELKDKVNVEYGTGDNDWISVYSITIDEIVEAMGSR